MTAAGAPAAFTPEVTRGVLARACRRAGLDDAGAVLLRHQTNAVYRLAAAPVVVKVVPPSEPATSADTAVALVRALAGAGFPTVRLAGEVPGQPLAVGGYRATFWRYLPQPAGRRIRAGDLGEPLRRLHALAPLGVAAPPLDPPAAIAGSLRAGVILDAGERCFLQGRCADLAADYARLAGGLRARLVHGDPQHRNTLWDGDRVVLADWDSAAVGPVEWDAVTVEVHCRRFGHPAGEYEGFAAAYGRDVRDWGGYELMRDVRELRMITTNARKSPPGSPAAEEVRRRVAALRAGVAGARWNLL
jgi:Ser/Thr protein kinase RdoA (MazF antagonist)